MNKRIKQLEIGSKYGEWTVLEYSGIYEGSCKAALWKCQCSCGTIKNVQGSALRLGHTKKCSSCSATGNPESIKYRFKDSGKDLYMIQVGPYVKIGVSSDVNRRLRDIESLCPYPAKLIGVWKDYAHMEQKWHEELAHLHYKGEWYKFG